MLPSRLLAPSALAAAISTTAAAHFPFIVPDEGGATAVLVMSESLDPDDAVGVSLLAGARLVLRDGRGGERPLNAPPRDAAAASMSLALPGEGTRLVTGVVDLGVMERGSTPHVLVYHPKSIIGDALDPATDLPATVPVEIVPVETDAGVALRLEFDGRPVADAPLTVVRPGAPDVELTTGADGGTPPVAAGRVGAWARRWVEAKGERDGRAYEQVRHYATLVADIPGSAETAAPEASSSLARAGLARAGDAVAVAHLPRAIASFGATTLDGFLYVYGGHAGTRHDYRTSRARCRTPGRACG